MTTTVSLITATMNSSATVAQTMRSVADQDHTNIEHIVVDGASTDDTLEVVRSFDHVATVITEPDGGIYEAFNRGIAAATGDVVGFINSDDWYARRDAISAVVAAFETGDIEASIGDVAFVDGSGRQRRRYRSKSWKPWQLRVGLMPPHPSFFTRRQNYDRFGVHREDLRIASDYDVVARMLYVHRLPYQHVPGVLVHMTPNGRSNASRESRQTINAEVREISAELGIDLVPGWVGLKYLTKTAQWRPAR